MYCIIFQHSCGQLIYIVNKVSGHESVVFSYEVLEACLEIKKMAILLMGKYVHQSESGGGGPYVHQWSVDLVDWWRKNNWMWTVQGLQVSWLRILILVPL